MSVNPVFAALTGLILLGQSLTAVDWLAIAAIVTASAMTVRARWAPVRQMARTGG
jgi:inner membrane transporter RhtA